jgi:hypothetical protein
MDVYRLIEGEFTPLGCLLGNKICGGDLFFRHFHGCERDNQEIFEEKSIESMLPRSES